MAKKSKYSLRLLTAAGAIIVLGVLALTSINSGRARADNPSDQLSVTQSVQDDSASRGSTYTPSALPSLLRMAGALIVVVICIYVGLYLLKRLTTKRFSGNRRHCLIEVVETAGIAPKKSVSLIRVADKAVLVGVTDSHVTFLTELDAEHTAQVMANCREESAPDRFQQLLRSVSDRFRQTQVKRRQATVET
ncbi:MAG TPA: flagellar biosynthetic protein FliO [Candidatus Deferrimicrobium sp.]|nr:flagellar biosynthetic protein FliO [Candidatus Deferrimicrobium sp.]